MENVSNVGGQQHQTEGTEDFRALGGNDPHHQREHAIGGQGKDEAHDTLGDLVEGNDDIAKELAFLTGDEHAAAEDQRNENDLQHRRGGQGVDEVVREDVDNSVHEVCALGLVFRALSQLQHREAALEDARDDKADHAGDRGGHQEVGDSLPADLADLLDIAHLDHAVHNAQKHQGDDNELQEVDEDVAEGLDVLCGKGAGRFRAHGRPENGADDDTGHQADQDLQAEVHAFLLTH